MISICIPVYNDNVVALVQELSKQLKDLAIGGEILVFDDCSEEPYRLQNNSLPEIAFVQYQKLGENTGRIKIRSLLAKAAKCPWLLFIDSDSSIDNNHFLLHYFNAIDERTNVITGGRRYALQPPADGTKRLHWKYGKEREAKRGRKQALHTNNFLVSKEVFEQLKFPSYIQGYGHEDTWMQMEFQRKRIGITHINNPVVHMGLEETNKFLDKSDQASKNLLLLASYEDKALLKKHSALYNAYYLLSRSGFANVFTFLFRFSEKRVLRNLRSSTPSLFYFDMLKLHRLVQLSKRHPF